jgi:hypothetical protein
MKKQKAKLLTSNSADSVLGYEISARDTMYFGATITVLHVEGATANRKALYIMDKKDRADAVKYLTRMIDGYKEILDEVNKLDFD